MAIYFTSDLHLGHNREFLFGPRGFGTIEDHDVKVLENIKNTINPEDDFYILGDLMLNDENGGFEKLNQIPGKIHIILGNHDTDRRIELYKTLPNVVEVVYSTVIKYKKYRFYLSHYPTMTGNFENGHLKEMVLNLFGHTHSKEKFYGDRPYMYNVALDANDNSPVSVDEIINRMKEKVIECKEML